MLLSYKARTAVSSFIIFDNSKYLKALGIVLKSPNLMMRPMLLSHINDLVGVNKSMKYGFQIYEALIEQWLIRESNKAGIILKYGETYKELLYQFSKALARDLYLNRKLRNNKLSLKVNEIINNPNGLQLKDIEGNDIGIDKYDQGSRSLLNRNAVGEYKFSHKSILEYFLALEVLKNEKFRDNFHFDSDLDTAKKFFLEMLRHEAVPKEKLEKINFNKLGILENEFETFTSREYLSTSFDEIFKVLSKSTFYNIVHIVILISMLFSSVNIIFFSKETTLTKSFSNKWFLILVVLTTILSSAFMFYRLLKVKLEMTNEDSKPIDISNEAMRRLWGILPWNNNKFSNDNKVSR